MSLLQRLVQRNDPPVAAWVLFVVAAAAVAVAGYLHGRLFWLNAVASGVVVAALLLGRALLFAVGGLSISLGAIIWILISHSTSFFGFAEQGFDSRATIIVVAEIVAAAAILLALVVSQSRIVTVADTASGEVA